MKGKITINESGVVSVPDNVMMQDFEIAELFEVMIPTIRANIRSILKTNIVIADCTNGATLVATFYRIITGWIWSWLLLFGFNHGRQRYSESGHFASAFP